MLCLLAQDQVQIFDDLHYSDFRSATEAQVFSRITVSSGPAGPLMSRGKWSESQISLKCLVEHCAKSLAAKCTVHMCLRYKYCHTSWKKTERSCTKGHNDKEQNNKVEGRSVPAKSKFQYLATWLSVDTCTYTSFVGYMPLLCWQRDTEQQRPNREHNVLTSFILGFSSVPLF